MNREQRRKEKRKIDKLDEKTNIKPNNETYRLIKICLIVVIILTIIYYIIGVFVTKEINLSKDNTKTEEKVESNNKNILANSTFEQAEEEYYVYFYDFKNENTEISSTISSKLTDSTIYKVDTADVLNKNYVVEEGSNKNAKKLEELKVLKDTIIKIKNDEIVNYYEGVENIKNDLS